MPATQIEESPAPVPPLPVRPVPRPQSRERRPDTINGARKTVNYKKKWSKVKLFLTNDYFALYIKDEKKDVREEPGKVLEKNDDNGRRDLRVSELNGNER